MATDENLASFGLYSAAAPILDNLAGLIGPGSRFFPPYLLAALALAAVALRLCPRQLPPEKRRNIFGQILDPKVYFQASCLVDLKVVIANRLFTPLIAAAGAAAMVGSAYFTASLFLSDAAIENAGGANFGWAGLAAITLAVTLASDFTTYWVHRAHHESSLLWPFHKLHHSAETLTPLTFARKHPVYDLVRALANALLVGPAQGLVFAMFGKVSLPLILGVNAAYAIFHWTGSNLRHSHVWLSYGPFLSRILISPAQHQIHHSLAPRHHNTNYGEIFALWDWMFGSLYAPKEYEALEFGVADKTGAREPQAHPSLKDAYLVPFKESLASLNGADNERAASTPPV